ncbi:MAG: hypothetical protein NDJ24_06740 [Alphaproteobacteria bacterium]|nr:hypothetical protein [Alphaproteobacteria bacterium]
MNLPFDSAAGRNYESEEFEAFQSLGKLLKALGCAEETLRPLLGNSLRLTLIDTQTVEAGQIQWEPFFTDHPDIADRYYGTWQNQGFVPASTKPDYLRDNIHYFYNPAAFNVAVWHGETLCGVACGGYKGEQERGFVSVMLREANPMPTQPLRGKIGLVVHEAAAVYARELGVGRVCYIGPFSEGAEKVHKAMGFRKENIEFRPGWHTEAYVGYVTEDKQRSILAERPELRP